MGKTNAVRIIEKHNVKFEILDYDSSDGNIDGISVANKIHHNPEIVYKTLVGYGSSKNVYVFCIPVEFQLNLKSAAKITKEKKIEMLPVKDLLKTTGYIRGGCSPIGMKKQFKTFVDETSLLFDEIIFSAGTIGKQIKLNPLDLEKIIGCEFSDLLI